MANAITRFTTQPPASFGSNEELNAIIERMEALIPIELTDQERKNLPDKVRNLNNSYLKAAQLSVFYRLIPGVDIHILPFGSNYSVDVGVEAWKKAADRYCSLHGISYHAVYEEMDPEELKRRRGANYTSEDVGYICYLWRSDKAAVYEIFGAKEAITKGYGHWAKKAKQVNNVWKEDQIPVQRTKHDVARRRALKAALKSEFSLDSLLAAAPNEVAEGLKWLDKDASRSLEDREPMQKKETIITEEGFIVEEPTIVKRDPNREEEEGSWEDGVWGDLEPEEPEEEDDNGHWEDAPLEEDMIGDPELAAEYREIGEKLEGQALTLLEWSRKQNAESNGPADVLQYRILVGEVDKIIGRYHHNLLFGVLLGREVHSDNPPGEKFVRYLLHFIQKEVPVKGDDGKSIKEGKKVKKQDNPGYRETFVEAIKVAWEQIGQPPLPPTTEPSQDLLPF